MRTQIYGLLFLLAGCAEGEALPDSGATPDLAMPTTLGDGSVAPPDLAPASDQALPFAEGKPLWGRTYSSQIMDVTTATDGSIYIAGDFYKADFGDGPVTSSGDGDIFLLKFDKNGQRLWARTFGRSYLDMTGKVVADKAGNVVVVGVSLRSAGVGTHDAFVAYYASDGTQRYFRIYGGPLDSAVDTARAAAFASDGSLYVTGGFEDRINFGGSELVSAGDRDGYLLHLSAAGAHLSSQRFGFTGYDQSSALASMPDGDLIMTGTGGYPIDFGDGMVGSDPTVDTFLVRYSPQGAARWSKRFKLRPSSETKVAAVADGSLWLVGDLNTPVDFGGGPRTSATGKGIFTAHYSGAGGHLDSYLIGSLRSLYINNVAVDTSGQIILGGMVAGDLDFGFGNTTDADGTSYFLKQAPTGQVRWVHRFGGNYSYDEVKGVAVTPDNQVLVGGGLSKNITLGAVALSPFTYLLAVTP